MSKALPVSRYDKGCTRGGALEWYNQCETGEGPWGHGIFPIIPLGDFLRAARDRYMSAIEGAVILK